MTCEFVFLTVLAFGPLVLPIAVLITDFIVWYFFSKKK